MKTIFKLLFVILITLFLIIPTFCTVNAVSEDQSTSTDSSYDASQTTKVKTTTLTEEKIGSSNILNLTLIVIGIILILLSVAILIKLNS